jgi:hypothetical protein
VIDRLRALGAFVYDFFIGDDPLIAAAVVISLGLTSVLAAIAVPAWWILPLAVAAVLSYSLHRATRL